MYVFIIFIHSKTSDIFYTSYDHYVIHLRTKMIVCSKYFKTGNQMKTKQFSQNKHTLMLARGDLGISISSYKRKTS